MKPLLTLRFAAALSIYGHGRKLSGVTKTPAVKPDGYKAPDPSQRNTWSALPAITADSGTASKVAGLRMASPVFSKSVDGIEIEDLLYAGLFTWFC